MGQEEKGTTEDEILDGITDSLDVSLSELRELVFYREAWRAAIIYRLLCFRGKKKLLMMTERT